MKDIIFSIMFKMKNQIIYCIITLMLGTFLSLINPLILKFIVDDILAKNSLNYITFIIFLLLSLLLFESLFLFFNSYSVRMFIETSEKEFKLHMYNKLFGIRYNDFLIQDSDEYINNYIIDIKTIFSFIMECFHFLLNICFSTILITIILFYYNIKMALISFSIIPIYIIIFAISRNYSRKNYEESRELNGNENIVFKNIVECMPVIRIFNAKSFYFSKIQDMLIKIINKNIKIYLFENIILTSLYIINTLIPILIIITGISLIANNEITIGVLIVFYTYSFRLIPLINQFVNFFYFYQQVYFSYKKVNKIFEYDEPKDNFIMNDIKFDINKILIKNLSVERNGKKILHNINLEFNKKDIVCLYGENGCGKTTLLNVISGLLKAEQGDIYIDDMNIENINPELYFEYVTYFPQNCYLLNDTIINNITMGRKIDMNTIIQVCNKLCIYDFINSLEDKFNFKITGNGEKLSGGERKMICFARMLLHKAKIILLDEFSNDLDNKHKKIINNILTEIKDNSIIIYVTHFNEDIGLANKFIYLHEGKILNVICENLEAKISKLVMDL